MSLSTRAREAEVAIKDLPIWAVIANLWDPETNPNGIVSLGVAENSLMHDTLSKHIHENLALKNPAFTYGDGPTGSKRLKNALSKFLTRHLKPVKAIEPAHLAVTNGCSAAVEHLSWAVADSGEGILLGQPYYGTFIPDLTGRPKSKAVPVPFHGADPFSENAVAKYEAALLQAQSDGTAVRALLLCNPHNPLGRCYPKSVIVDLLRLCAKYGLHFISDEIYALSLWENTVDTSPAPVAFQSVLSIELDGIIDPSMVHVVWGMSKDFGANGIRLGAIISQSNPSLHTALVSVGLYSSVSSLSEHLTANILEDDIWTESYIMQNQSKLAQQYRSVTGWANDNGIAYAPGVHAAFFLWVDLGSAYIARHLGTEFGDVTETITEALSKHKIFLASGREFGSEQPGWFRIVFSHPDDYLFEGLSRVIQALEA